MAFPDTGRPGAMVPIPREADLLLARLAAAGIPTPPPNEGRADLALNAQDVQAFEAWRQTLAPDGGRRWISVGPGGKQPVNFWPIDRYEQLIRRLIDRYDIWPVIFPAVYILGGRALAGPNGGGLLVFTSKTGIPDFIGYIAVGTTVWMWQNVVLWNVGFALREEQLRGTLESNWLSPTWRFSFLIGNSVTHMFSMLVFLAIAAFEFIVFFGVHIQGNPLLALPAP
jgi:hypothetical protein